MAESRSFLETIIATAGHKAAAARARSETASASERPRDVILAACHAIAEQLELDGFSFQKSGPKLKRIAGDLTFEILFQSDRNNIAGRRAAVWIHARVGSQVLSKWRADHPHPWVRHKGLGSESVTGGQIGNLTDNPSWMEWDFADAAQRPAELENAVSAIRKIIFPFFGLFDDPKHAVRILIHRRGLGQSSLVEYALAALGPQEAKAALRSFLAKNPQINKRFVAAHAKFGNKGLPAYRSDLGSDLAALAIATQIDPGA